MNTFNTSTLGYKLVTGSLRERRKHSEQLNKYLAGLFDADGCIGLERVGDGYIHTRFTISQSAAVDRDFVMIRSLHKFYGLGVITFGFNAAGVSTIFWRASSKETKMLFNLIGKHLRIKGTHYQNMIALQEKYSKIRVSESEWQDIIEYRSESRSASKWLKRPKHLSYAWVAGYLDGDGNYSFRRSQNTLSIRVPSSDIHILEKLKEDFGGSILKGNTENYKVWRRGLGKGHISFSLPFLKKMQQNTCLVYKYKVISDMINYLESTQVAKTKQSGVERLSDSLISE